jgi:Bacterial regulatory proteins, gntR family
VAQEVQFFDRTRAVDEDVEVGEFLLTRSDNSYAVASQTVITGAWRSKDMRQLAMGDENGLGAPTSLQQRVYENLRAGLIGGLFAPGEVVSLRRIAAANGVSPMPVREAVKRLISEGAIELLPNRTIAVPNLRRRDFVELTRGPAGSA